MRRNQRLTFTKKEDRPVLTLDEVRYWKRMFESISKMGLEHEFNLKENVGKCSGKNLICPCNHPEKEERQCYTKCKIYNSCKLRNKYECPGIYCIEFVSPCPSCPDAVKDCSRCEFFNNPKLNPAASREVITDVLKPSNSLSFVGETGVYGVVTDGSLLGNEGVEVVTVGRRISYESFFKQTDEIMKRCVANGAYLNERCSIHMHLIASYFTMIVKNGKLTAFYEKGNTKEPNFSEFEKPMPEIILANFHQLIRRYHNALTWITSAGDDYKKLTRWIKFRKPILKYSAVRHHMLNVIRDINSNDDGHGGRYSIMNYAPIKFNADGTIKTFHLESRFCDGLLSASASSALSILLYAFLLKAVVLSQFGIIHSGDSVYMNEAREIQASLLNNNGNWGGPRYSDTSNFEPYREVVRQQTNDMLDLLRSELKPHGPVMGILRKLADMPCSMRLCVGNSWEKIEGDLSDASDTESKVAKSILSLIDMSYVDECVDVDEWVNTISEDLKLSQKNVGNTVKLLMEKSIIAWDGVSGTLSRC